MKLDPKFKSSENKLFFLDGRECSLEQAQKLDARTFSRDVKNLTQSSKLFILSLSWKETGLDEDSYNENFLADLRDALKYCEEVEAYAVISPLCDSAADSPAQKEAFTASMKHSARRIKDCENVIGYEIPEAADPDFFVEELSAKHAQYIFFSKNENLLKNPAIVKL